MKLIGKQGVYCDIKGPVYSIVLGPSALASATRTLDVSICYATNLLGTLYPRRSPRAVRNRGGDVPAWRWGATDGLWLCRCDGHAR